MNVYKFTGSNISGGQHSSSFIVLAKDKKQAKELLNQFIEKEKAEGSTWNDWNVKLNEEVEEMTKAGVFDYDTGDCC